MKRIFVIPVLIILLSSCANENRGWSAKDRKQMIDECVKAASGGALEAQARSYCECMQPKLEAKYPKIKDMKGITATMIQNSPELQEEALKCLGDDIMGSSPGSTDTSTSLTGWTKIQRDLYVRSCAMAARQGTEAMDSALAQSYCDCMTRKIEKRFSFKDANEKIETELNKPEWQSEIRACLGQQ